MSGDKLDLTAVVDAVASGRERAAERLAPLLYEELREVARALMARERSQVTLQPTALVHEAYLRLLGGRELSVEGRTHFLRAAAESMRRVLVDAARVRRSQKRGGGRFRVTLTDLPAANDHHDVELLQLDEVLQRLGDEDPRLVEVVTLRYFSGLSIEETALALGISAATVKREWQFARAWLARELER